jgi:DUF1365 family protein
VARETPTKSKYKATFDAFSIWFVHQREYSLMSLLELPYPDAKVANKLCFGGPCYYLLPVEDAITGDNDANNKRIMT